MGIRNYRSLLEIAEPIDYVVVAVPRSVTPHIVRDCIEKKVGAATLFTSGFAETGTKEGLQLEETLTRMATEANFNLIGPNCMGISNPAVGLRHDINQYHGESGQVGFISQSGTHAIFFSLVGALDGVKISKSVSYGNAAVIDSADYLEYFAEDKETKVVGLYIEGVKDGRRFLRRLKEVANTKPVVVWKGGFTDEGNRATASHTGSMAGSAAVWGRALRQCGAITTGNLDELVGCTKLLLHMKAPRGFRVGLVAQSGGQSVAIADSFSKAGLEIPLLSEDTHREFATFFNVIGGSHGNPLDISWHSPSINDSVRILDILDRAREIDSVVMELSLPFLSQIWRYYPHYMDDLMDAIGLFKVRCGKSFLVVISAGNLEIDAIKIRNGLVARQVPSFFSFETAATCLKRVAEHYVRRSDHSWWRASERG